MRQVSVLVLLVARSARGPRAALP